MTTSERKSFVTSIRMCFICFSASDGIQQCPSTSLCKICQKKHHTTVRGNSSQPNPGLPAKVDSVTILRTANVQARSQNDRIHHLRALVDNCAQPNVINLRTMHRLGIKPTEAPPDRVIGVNQKNAMSSHSQMNLAILQISG